MGQRAGIVERDVTIGEVPAFVAEPSGAAGAARIVIAPEIFGVSPWIRSVARRLAGEGFRAIAPEIFIHETEPIGKDRASWMARIRRLDIPRAVGELRAALDSLEGGKKGVIGFCLGGALAILTAAEAGADACVDCYGRPRWAHTTPAPHAIDAARSLTGPLLAVYGTHDTGIPVEEARELPKAELAFYDAGHAFLNDTRPDMYVAAQADLAWARIIGFLRRNLG